MLEEFKKNWFSGNKYSRRSCTNIQEKYDERNFFMEARIDGL